jgi:type IV pilus assembly protein PilM
MALPFLTRAPKKRDHIVVIDLGTRTTKAVYLQRSGDQRQLANFVLQEAPAAEAKASPQHLGEHLRGVVQGLGARTKQVVLVTGVMDSVVRHAEMPLVPVDDMRMMLKLNPKGYLQQDLPDHVFDCQLLPPKAPAGAPVAAKETPKLRVLVGGAKRSLITELQAAAKVAGLTPTEVFPGLVCIVNAFEAAQPEVFAKEAVALVDIGFRHSSVSILHAGELVLSRVVGIGADAVTAALGEALGTSYAEAESIKQGIPDEVQTTLQEILSPLGRELRASLDFFEHQHDKPVSQAYVSGGSARSDFFLKSLQSELMVPCQRWNPASSLTLSLPAERRVELDQAAPQLACGIGAACALF